MRMKFVDCKCEMEVKHGYKELGNVVGAVWRERYLPPTTKFYHLQILLASCKTCKTCKDMY